ncbi:hypothetical protein [Streptomyces fradiae]|uniref:hypothetical protein n=1 Tax=Streptomyces fradiae TaxID=1906 RepID=UPI0035BE40B8
MGSPVRAPHAQASGLVKHNGDVDRGTGIAAVTKGAPKALAHASFIAAPTPSAVSSSLNPIEVI